MSFVDPKTFFENLLSEFEQDDRTYSSSSSDSDDDDIITATRLLGAKGGKKPNEQSRWYQLADQSDDEDVVTYYDRLGEVVRGDEEEEEVGIGKGESEKDKERRMRQRTRFFEKEMKEEARLVVSHKKRRLDELNAIIDKVEFLKQDKNWVEITEEIKELETKVMKKMLKMDQSFKAPPKKYIKFMIDLRTEVADLSKNKAYLKDLPLPQKKALPKLLAPLRNSSYLKEFNHMVDEYLENPESYDVEENFGLEEEEESLRRLKEKLLDEEGEEDDDDIGPKKWLLADASSSDESDDDDLKGNFYSKSDLESDEESDEESIKKQKVAPKKKEQRKKREVDEDDDLQLDDAQIEEKVAEFRASRGKKLLSNQELIDQLTLFYKYAESDEVIIQVLTELISINLEKYSSSDSVMYSDEWIVVCDYFSKVLEIIETNPELKFVEFKEVTEKKKGVIPITGNPCGLVEQIDIQYYRGLKLAEAFSPTFLSRLQYQANLLNVLSRAMVLYQSRNNLEFAGRLAFRILSHIYFRKPSDHQKLLQAHKERTTDVEAEDPGVIQSDLTKTIQDLSKIIFQCATEDMVHKSVLMNVYHLALKDLFPQARDMLMMSGIPDLISSNKDGDKSLVLDGDIQVLYNRVIAQLGLAAFRSGLVKETYNTLREIFAQQDVKGLIGQSMRYSKDSHKQDMDKRGREELEKREKERFIPFHMHINVEAIEVAFFITTMLIETAPLRQKTLDINKKRFQTFASKKYFRSVEDRTYASPAENTKDKLYVACVALREGRWLDAYNAIASLEIWSYFEKKDDILKSLQFHVKVESMRSYIFTNMKFYQNISIERLSQMFSLESSVVKATVSKMIVHEKLYAFINEMNNSIYATKEEPSDFQRMALSVIDSYSNVKTPAQKPYRDHRDHRDHREQRERREHRERREPREHREPREPREQKVQ